MHIDEFWRDECGKALQIKNKEAFLPRALLSFDVFPIFSISNWIAMISKVNLVDASEGTCYILFSFDDWWSQN